MSEPRTENKAGLEGIIAADTAISDINGEKGELVYAGYDIRELAEQISFEECCYLLWQLRLPTAAELKTLRASFDREAILPPALLDVLKTFAKQTPPMHMLRTAVSMLSHFDKTADANDPEALLAKSISLTAKMPGLVAAYHRLRCGKDPVAHKAGMSLAQSFVYQLTGEEPLAEATRAMDVAFVLHAEHGFNASTFAARVTIATLSDIYSAVTSAIGALKGPLHGGANERVISILQEIGSLDRVQSWVHEQFTQKKKIFGFGHRVYKTLDPRAAFLKRMSHDLGRAAGEPQWYDMSAKMEEIVKAEKGLNANVDFYSASVYHCLKIPVDLFTPIFAIARTAGWTAHVIEQLKNNRLIRPLARYVGPRDLKFVPLAAR